MMVIRKGRLWMGMGPIPLMPQSAQMPDDGGTEGALVDGDGLPMMPQSAEMPDDGDTEGAFVDGDGLPLMPQSA